MYIKMCSNTLNTVAACVYSIISIYLILYPFVFRKYKPHCTNVLFAIVSTVIVSLQASCSEWYITWGVLLAVASLCAIIIDFCFPVVFKTECLPR